eukprot:COSAG05_NODE_24267_length_252_cov_1.320261_1_plen_53_part_01
MPMTLGLFTKNFVDAATAALAHRHSATPSSGSIEGSLHDNTAVSSDPRYDRKF